MLIHKFNFILLFQFNSLVKLSDISVSYKMRMKNTKILFFLLCLPLLVLGQNIQLSPQAEISIITCGPGEELYSSFGHSAFRVNDPVLKLDLAYNYGTFDFNKPNFYIKFARGKLLYQLSVNHFENFVYNYKIEDRWVKEQVLNLTPNEKNELFNFLNINAKPENREYLYDFFFDNCSTKIRDVLEKVLNNNIQFNYPHIKEEYTFRKLIQMNLDANSWGSLGIDLGLGSKIDRKATPYEYMFLPDYVMYAFDNATYKNKPIVKETNALINSNKNFKQKGSFLLSPGALFSLIMLIVGFITYRDYKKNKRSKWLDFTLFFLTGLVGIFILLLWFATDHTMTKYNFNFLWAFPINIIVSFYLVKKNMKKWIRKYVFIPLGLIGLVFIFWIFKIQVFPIVIIPILIMLVIRYLYIIKYSQTLKD